MTDELWALPIGIDIAVGQAMFFALFAIGFTTLAYYANKAKHVRLFKIASTLAVLTSIGCILFQNALTGFTPAEFWNAISVIWESNFFPLNIYSAIAFYPYAFLVVAFIGVSVGFLKKRHHA